MRLRLICLCLLAASTPAAAQEGAWGNIAGDLAMSNLNHQVMEDMLGIDSRPSRGTTRGKGTSRPVFRATAAPVRNATAFPFVSTAASRKAAAEAFVGRIAQRNPDAARATAAEMGRHDFSRIYAGIVAPFGYGANDAIDATAAYTLLGWLIATGAPDPRPSQARAVRAQFAAVAAGNPKYTGGRRARLGEELKLQFVTLHAGWRSAKREGKLRAYSDGVARLFQTSGVNLRAMRLTDRGLVSG